MTQDDFLSPPLWQDTGFTGSRFPPTSART